MIANQSQLSYHRIADVSGLGSVPVQPSPRTIFSVTAGPHESGAGNRAQVVSLGQLKVGECGTIVEKRLDEADRAMLRAMGLEANSTVRICRVGEPCIVAVITGGASGGRLDGGCCRIGLARPLADRIIVCPSVSGWAGRVSTDSTLS